MAKIAAAAPEERYAVLVKRLEPGRASMIDWAFLAGSTCVALRRLGVREVVIGVVMAGRAREGRRGRERAAPGGDG